MPLALDALNLRSLARGCAVLGAGAGGDTDLGVVMAQHAIAEHGPVAIVTLDELADGAWIMPCGMVGAPTIAPGRIWSGDEGAELRATLEELRDAPVAALMCFGIGGANGLLPVGWAARCGLPLVDGDGMGRAFSQLHQQAMHVAGIAASPVVLTDGRANTIVLRAADDRWAARLASGVAASLGGVCAASLYGMTAGRARGAIVEGSLSLAVRLGAMLRSGGIDRALGALEEALGAVLLIDGRVVELERDGGDGNAAGFAVVQGMGVDAGRRLRVELQDGFLVALEDGAVCASVPDMICLLATDSGSPIASGALAQGQAVAVLAAPGPALWQSPRGIEAVGPRAFGYEIDHVPLHGRAPR